MTKLPKNRYIEQIQSFFTYNGSSSNAVIELSGNQFDMVLAALCVTALGKDRVIGVILLKNEQEDVSGLLAFAEELGIKKVVVNTHGAEQFICIGTCKGWKNLDNMKFDFSKRAMDDLRERIKNAILHFIAHSCNGKVLRTCRVPAFKDNMIIQYSDEKESFSPLTQLNNATISEIRRKCGLKVFVE